MAEAKKDLTPNNKNDRMEDVKKKDLLIESIFNKNKNYMNDTQQKEFIDILNGQDEKSLNLYDKLSNHFERNNYHMKKTGYYIQYYRRIEMDLDEHKNEVEDHLKNGRTSAWATKFHEEFHQLDHILENTVLNRVPKIEKSELDIDLSALVDIDLSALGEYGNALGDTLSELGDKLSGLDLTPIGNTCISDIRTSFGESLINAIDTDSINQINLAIKLSGSSKQIRTFGELDESTAKLFVEYLKTKYPRLKEQAQIRIFTDAIGLASVDKIKIQDAGFWGHDSDYNIKMGRDGATAETWATFGSMYFTDSEDAIQVVQNIMPNTWEVLTNMMEQVLDYAEKNDLKYKEWSI